MKVKRQPKLSKQGERQPLEWKKIIANEATDKELISKIYNSSWQSTPEK